MGENSKPTNISVWGCCVSRDAVAFRQEKYNVLRYVQAVSPFTAFYGRPLKLKIEDFSEYGNVSNFYKRCICLDANKNAVEYVIEGRADWLLLDISEIRRNIYFWRNSAVLFTKNSNLNKMLSALKPFVGSEIPEMLNPAVFSAEERIGAINRLCDEFLKYYSPKNIILNEVYNVDIYLNSDNELKSFDEESKVINFKQNKFLKMAFETCKERLSGCHVIAMQSNNFADEKNRWGLSSLHYTPIYYDYVEKCISTVISSSSDEEETKCLTNLYELYNEKMLSCCMWARKNSYRREKHMLAAKLSDIQNTLHALDDKASGLENEKSALLSLVSDLQKSNLQLESEIVDYKERITALESEMSKLIRDKMLLENDR